MGPLAVLSVWLFSVLEDTVGRLGVELDYGWQGVISESWFLCMSANSTPLWELCYWLGGQYFTPARSRQL